MQLAIQEQPWQTLRHQAFEGQSLVISAATIFPEVNRPHTSDEDVQLLQRIAGHDRQAFSQFYDRYATVLFSMAIRILNDPEEAADVLQEVFVQVWEKG